MPPVLESVVHQDVERMIQCALLPTKQLGCGSATTCRDGSTNGQGGCVRAAADGAVGRAGSLPSASRDTQLASSPLPGLASTSQATSNSRRWSLHDR